MKIKIVPRSKVKVSRKSRSKYEKLKEAISKLEPNGDAIRVEYSTKKELNSIRNVAYTYNRETNSKVKSTTNSTNDAVFFFIEK
ncbi:hypothetical protein [Rhodohalobacter sp. 614A]|uniref:hypothetical protein n=1 Tax=Rhodohalobacter sp. 614A TaxID=2908649 RepID=UPI001F298ADA|nr:hypothetical protein [Rhodohalobacter sp. 614A]